MLMPNQGIPERRKASRAYLRTPINCEIFNPADDTVSHKSFIVNNINTVGLYIETDEVLLIGTKMNVSFQLPKDNNIIEATVEVVRTETTENQKGFGTGAVFVKLTEKDQETIQNFMERQDIHKLLETAIKNGASDLHLLANQAPVLRIRGKLQTLTTPRLDPGDVQKLLYNIMSKQQIRKYEQAKELDFGIQYDNENRFRVNLHQQRGFTEATIRLINTKVSSFEELNIPEAVKDLARLKDGLIVIAGPTGSGKTTTIAAMVELINREKQAVIITLERPIEYVHSNLNSIVKQREIGTDTPSFSDAIKSSLRQDPNVIVVGEIEDLDTVKTALVAAEAGYLVIVSIHAPNTMLAVDRLTSFFPPENRRQILSQLANCLRGIITQLLVPCKDHTKRALAIELLIANDAAKRIIRNDQVVQLPTVIQTGGAYKMQSISDSIKNLVDNGLVSLEVADYYSEEFSKYSK